MHKICNFARSKKREILRPVNRDRDVRKEAGKGREKKELGREKFI
jgi:hypothetical protein